MKDHLHKFQPYLLGLSIFLTLTAVSFEFHGPSVELVWKDHPLMPAAILLAGLSLSMLYMAAGGEKPTALAHHHATDHDVRLALLQELTPRQEEICRLIISGRSNKEITATLFIEASTLKTHINQIYKKLNVKSRKELRKRYRA